MMLYHGSHASALPSMQKIGIAPRRIAKGRNNWDHTVTSNRDSVYLTDAYAFHFASAACEKEDEGLLLEIPRDCLLPWLLCPDEDFMEQCSRGSGPSPERPNHAPLNWTMKKRTLYYRKIARYNASLADASLEHMGTAGYYGVIPWVNVRRYVTINWEAFSKANPNLWMSAVDTMVSAINYAILKERHRALTRWFFNDPVTADELLGIWPGEDKVEGLETLNAKRREAMSKVMLDRSGVTVHNLK